MRRFLARFVLASLGTWIAALVIPGINTDNAVLTFLLMGLLVAVGEVLIDVLRHGIAVLLFFIPGTLRLFLLRAAAVGIATALVTGFSFTSPVLVGLLGTALLLSLLFTLPLAS